MSTISGSDQLGLLGASLLASCAPVGTQTVEPIVEQANTTEAGATIPSYAELVAKAMGGGFDPESLEPGRAAALEQLRQTFFVRQYDTNGDQQLDGPILSELGENTVQWAVDGVTPYLAGEAINEVYGGGTDTALLVSGFRPGEPLVVSVAGANAELVNQGVPANGAHLVVMSPTQAVVTDERSNPVAEVGADGVWRAMEVMVTEVPTETPEPTLEPTATPAPELGMTRVNEETQVAEVYVGDGRYLEAPVHYKPEYVHTDEQGRVRYDAPGLHLFVSEGGEWQVTPFEEIEMNGFEVIYGAGGEYTITSDTTKAEERRREFFVSWVQTEANADYRQEIYGTAAPTDEQVWEHLQTNGLLVTDNLKVPFDDTYLHFYQLQRFAPDMVGKTLDTSSLGMVLVFESALSVNEGKITDEVGRLQKISGKLDVRFTPIQLMVDGKGRVYFVVVNHGVPDERVQRDFYTADVVFGGYLSTPQRSDSNIITSQFETTLNLFEMWDRTHPKDYWLFDFRTTVEEFNRGGGVRAVGSYGAYPEEVEGIYGPGRYLIEAVE